MLFLGLASCGGGGSGNSSYIADSGMRVSSEAIASNKYVTSMTSEILVAHHGGSGNMARESHVVDGGKNFIAYHLDNAKFYENGKEEKEYISLGIDENTGKINKISRRYDDGSIDIMEREGDDSSIFTQHVYKYRLEVPGHEYPYWTDSLPVVEEGYSKEQIKEAFIEAYEEDEPDALDDIIEAIENSTDMTPTEFVHRYVVDLQGNDLAETDQLKYADFGYLTILHKEIHEEGEGVADDNSVVFGGYKIKEIPDTTNFHDVEFRGKAIAALGYVHHNADQKIATNDNAATLQIDAEGTQLLTMPFNDYYTIVVEKHQEGEGTITWTGTTESVYKLNSDLPVQNQHINFMHYGDNSVPSEVVGGVKFQNNNVEFNGAFGLK